MRWRFQLPLVELLGRKLEPKGDINLRLQLLEGKIRYAARVFGRSFFSFLLRFLRYLASLSCVLLRLNDCLGLLYRLLAFWLSRVLRRLRLCSCRRIVGSLRLSRRRCVWLSNFLRLLDIQNPLLRFLVQLYILLLRQASYVVRVVILHKLLINDYDKLLITFRDIHSLDANQLDFLGILVTHGFEHMVVVYMSDEFISIRLLDHLPVNRPWPDGIHDLGQDDAILSFFHQVLHGHVLDTQGVDPLLVYHQVLVLCVLRNSC